MIRIVLGYRGALVRGALAALLSGQDDMTVVATLSHGDDVVPVATKERPDVMVLDYTLPGAVTVSQVCRALCRTLPTTRVLALLDRRSSAGVGRSLARLAPRVGLIGTESGPETLVDGVRRLARGEAVLDADLAMAAMRSVETVLTERECDVLRIAREGATAKEIASSLSLSTGTVRNYLSRAIAKTGARTRIEAVRIAHDAGWI